MTQGSLIGAYIFGSVGRARQDSLSDLDVLAVVKNGAGKVAEAVVASYVPNEFRSFKLSISWYGAHRLREMFRNGELFAWHLHRETIPLFDPERFLTRLGQPAKYRDFVADVGSFLRVLSEIPTQVGLNENNAVYEAGLIYVCLRNIAMSASWVLCEYPDFSRYSPFNLAGIEPCPISVKEFEAAMACRMAGQRGKDPPPGVRSDFVIDLFRRLDPWLRYLHSILQSKGTHGR